MYESIKLQAHNKGEMEAFHEVFSDEAKARSALAQFAKDNPPGKRFRTNIIDFHRWRRYYGVRISFVESDNEVEMDETDFVVYQVEKRRKTEPWSREEWKRLLANPKVERIGEGVDTKIWFTQPNTKVGER